MADPQGKSPYLQNILRRGVYEQEWTDVPDLKRQVRAVLRSDVGVPFTQADAVRPDAVLRDAKTSRTKRE